MGDFLFHHGRTIDIGKVRIKYKSFLVQKDEYLKEVKKGDQPEELIQTFCKILDIDRAIVCTKGKNSVERAILMEFLYRYCKITQPEIGRIVGGIDYSAVSYARKRLRQRIENDAGLRALFEGVDADLSRLMTLSTNI